MARGALFCIIINTFYIIYMPFPLKIPCFFVFFTSLSLVPKLLYLDLSNLKHKHVCTAAAITITQRYPPSRGSGTNSYSCFIFSRSIAVSLSPVTFNSISFPLFFSTDPIVVWCHDVELLLGHWIIRPCNPVRTSVNLDSMFTLRSQ